MGSHSPTDGSPHGRRKARLATPLALLAALVVAAVLGLALTHSSQGTERDGPLPPQFYSPLRTDATPIHIRLGGRDYYIPANYLDSPLDPGLEQDALLLVALLPTLEARTQENWDEFMRVPGWGRRVTMLIKVLPSRPDLFERRLEISQQYFGPFEEVGSYLGLRHLRSIERGGLLGRRDLFIDQIKNSINLIITCRFESDYPTPGCSHAFSHHNLLIESSYGRPNLMQWRSTQRSIESLLDQFILQPDLQHAE